MIWNYYQKIKMKNYLIFTGQICPYCGKNTEFVDSEEVYGKSYGMIYLCRDCKAWVGVHKGTKNALGRLANSELRDAKKEAHFYFDKLWKAKIESGVRKKVARGKAYKWLSQQLGISKEETHIGWFDVSQCIEVVKICRPIVERLNL